MTPRKSPNTVLREAGPKGVYAFAGAVTVIAFVLAWLVVNPVKEAAQIVTPSEPEVPPMLADHAERAPGEPRGESVGAAPSKTLPRPTTFFAERGIKYDFYASPNWSPRGFNQVEAITVHVTGPGTMAGMRSWFANPASNASAHLGVGKDGEVHQYVEMGDGAWHNGIVNRPDLSNPLIAAWVRNGINPNSRTVGIELLLTPGENLNDYPAMRESFYALMGWLSDTLSVPLDRTHVIGHYQVDGVNRSVDPRCCVDIDAVLVDLAGGAVAPQPTPTPQPPAEFPFWDGERHVFEGGRGDGWSYDPNPRPYGVWYYRNVAIWDACDPSWNGRRSPFEFWVNVGTWVFFEPVSTWVQAPEC